MRSHTSAAVAANLLASRPYDAAVVDIEMPIKGGAAKGQTPARASSA